MIRINLLPFRRDRKREEIRRQVSTVLLGVVFMVAVLWLYTQRTDSNIEKHRGLIQTTQTEIQQYKEKAEEVTQIKKKLKVLQEKLEIVNSLKAKRFEQLELVSRLPDLMVPEKMWVEDIKSTSSELVIKGVAFDNPVIADFMDRLEVSDQFATVDLRRTKSREFQNGVNLKAFEVSCKKIPSIASPGDKER